MDNNYRSDENQNEDFNLRTILDKYLIHWQWFVLAVSVSLIIAFAYLRYTTPQYQATTTVLVKDDKKGGMLSELSAFADMGLGNAMKSNVDNEIEILKSRTLVESTVKRLKLNIGLFVKGKVITREIYKNTPITVDFINAKPEFFTSTMVLEFVELTPNTFALDSESTIEGKPILLNDKKEFKYGELIVTQNGELIITRSKDSKNKFNDSSKAISIVVNPLENVVASFLSRLKVNPISKTSSVVELTITDPVIKKAEDFLDNLVLIYNDDAAADKNYISENTSKFIANRLILITQELDGVEQNVESFKRDNKVTDIESEAKLFIEGSNEYNKKAVETEIQLNVVASMLDFMKKSTNADLLPTNIIAGQGDASGLINSYNQLILERNRILKSATVANPSVIKLDQQITSLKSNVAESLGRLQSTLNIQKRNLRSQEGLLDTKIEKIPVQERQFRVIARQQKVKEELYLYLLQKREETAISLAATAPNARVVDDAKASKIPVSPKKNIIYLAALLLGFLIPFGILYLMDLLDTKVKNRFDITDKLKIPFLGDIPKSTSPNEMVDASSRTGSAEALRIIRTNLDFMLNQVPEGTAKTIFMTSTIPGEGKTFISANLAGVFALSGKKVLLMGMDIRNPKLSEYIDTHETRGLTNYLTTANASIKDYIYPLKGFEELYVLSAGSIPPNPTELLMNKKIDELFVQFKKEYDYIIVDTAPVSLVSDTLMIAKYADTFVYVVRANYLDKRMLHLPELFYKENKLPNMALLLNDTDSKKGYGYGYGYGYGAAEEKKPWYKTIFNK
ncbi:MAG: polysaccharide biosynthesis tyrosine autokinase [Flavobacterium sp.]|uniref:GumC family protein n=1 Tax=Flavobacterium sp. TaxID=239 RepID=UPI0026210545|nr:polysaccharide biosynthesis tyrosine autokinase [Flavobacterium sp.]MDD5149975.1 polysaccharide biosynthesis tyrosine autokinase [Flavobacterium sp.]